MISPSDQTAGLAPIGVNPREAVAVYGKRILLVLPWQKHVSPITAFCAAQLTDRRRTASAMHFGDAFVAHSRNSCADLFLSSDMEWMLTIDDDMVVPFGDAAWYRAYTGFKFAEQFMAWNAIDRLLSHGKTLVGALYFGRHAKAPPVYNEGHIKQEAEYARRGPYDLIKPTRWVGTGCMMIHRSVFEDVEKKFPRLARGGDKKGGQWFTSTEASVMDRLQQLRGTLNDGTPLDGEKAYKALAGIEAIIRLAEHENPLGSGEDVSFCLRAQAAGHTPYVDMGLVCGHIGSCVYGPHNTQ